MSKLMDIPESKKWPELQFHWFRCLKNCIPYKKLFLIMNQESVLFKNDSTNSVKPRGNIIRIVVLNIFMPFRTKMITFIFSDTDIKTLVFINYRYIE